MGTGVNLLISNTAEIAAIEMGDSNRKQSSVHITCTGH